MYHVAVAFDVQPDRHEDFIAACHADARDSAVDEPFTQRFELVKDENDPNRFYLDEVYDDAAAFDKHMAGPHFAKFFERIGDIAEGPTWLIRGTRVVDPTAS
ncbi:antibiotic biosynthesis monooxygenase [Streptomyces sp. CB09001]|uniref:putative quinol monooxygenase n=1 Tax=unclassified Streptomyces TaxID=2593676 RepID=UPI000E2144AF|nr:putative quinol monooxygenase [Streptomyces sp. CB09001]AXL89206.1 antibiotic biosynthesis monooxygenase [Streptomyces sp. CB09001]